jgi:hypothetical protein
MPARNTVCLWFNGAAEEAARFYARTFPDSRVDAVHRAPGDYPSGKEGDVLTGVHPQRGVLVPGQDRRPGGNRPPVECNCRQRRGGEPVRLVQGQVGAVVADHAGRADRRHC